MAPPVNVLRIGVLAPISSLDPGVARGHTANLLIQQVFEAPYRRAADDGFEPVLMAGPMVPGDAGAFEAEVREGLTFSDGSPLTATEIVAALETESSVDDFRLSSDGNKLIVKPRGPMEGRPEEALSGRLVGIAKRVDGKAIGSGPFVVAAHDAEVVRLEPNPHAPRRPPLDAVEVSCHPRGSNGQPDALVAAMAAGKVDLTIELGPDDGLELTGFTRTMLPGMGTAFLYLNTEKEHLEQATVRRAIDGAIDRLRLTAICYPEPGTFVADQLLPPALGIRASLPPRPADEPVRVRLPDRLRMVCVWGPRPYLPRPRKVATAIAEQLRALDTRVEIEFATDEDHYTKLLRAGKYDLALGGWIADTFNPLDYLRAVVSSGGIPVFGRSPTSVANYARWEDAEVDRALAQAQRTGTRRAAETVLARVADQVPLIPLMYGPLVTVHSARVSGLASSDVLPDLAGVTLAD